MTYNDPAIKKHYTAVVTLHEVTPQQTKQGVMIPRATEEVLSLTMRKGTVDGAIGAVVAQLESYLHSSVEEGQ